MLAMRHRVVAFDFEDPETDLPSSDHYVAQAEAVIRAIFHAEPVHIVGYSFGAVIAAQLAARCVELVRSLVLVAGWLKTDNQQALRNEVWTRLNEISHDALASFSVLCNFSPTFLNSKNPAEIATLIEGARNGPDRTKKMSFNRIVDLSSEIGRVSAPTLVVGCKDDATTPIAHSKLLCGAIPDSRFVELQSGHGVVHERPSELFTVIDDFVRNPGKCPAGSIVANSHA
jgi:pimeloyl-ACP methyl ester carboxylesterase